VIGVFELCSWSILGLLCKRRVILSCGGGRRDGKGSPSPDHAAGWDASVRRFARRRDAGTSRILLEMGLTGSSSLLVSLELGRFRFGGFLWDNIRGIRGVLSESSSSAEFLSDRIKGMRGMVSESLAMARSLGAHTLCLICHLYRAGARYFRRKS
jgi:hypothetical protein